MLQTNWAQPQGILRAPNGQNRATRDPVPLEMINGYTVTNHSPTLKEVM